MEAVLKSGLAGGIGALPERRPCPCSVSGAVGRGVSCNSKVRKSGRLIKVSCRAVEEPAKSARLFARRSGSVQEQANLLSEVAERNARLPVADASELDLPLFTLPDDFVEFVDVELRMASPSLTSGRSKDMLLPPKLCTLRAFGGGEGVVKANPDPKSVYELLAANVEASAQVKNFETLSGRLAMMAFFLAIGVEILTGNSVFRGIDVEKLLGVAALCGVATVSAAGFAFAWRAKGHVASLLSKGCQNLVDSAIEKVVDGLFFDENTFP